MRKLIHLLFALFLSSSLFAQSNTGGTVNNQQNNQHLNNAGSSVYVPGTIGGYTNPLELHAQPGTTAASASSSSSKPSGPPAKQTASIAFKDDPTETRMYKLSNGLTVYLSRNELEPRIQTYIAVRTGSKNDPHNATGLAHYLEHMLFKGTENIGTIGWEREKIMLDAISQLYEEHRNEKNEARKKEIYAEIDRLSQEAAAFVVPNEYDKMIGSLGAKGTNAWTSLEETVYTNDIPANELEKWLIVESERFHTVVLRLFHTELEAVYEEFNMGQDRDGSKMWKAFMRGLFPTHTYGTQTTIGEAEHLKNPSMEKIKGYFSAYYVPNNMAICLSGDINYDETIALIEKYFGGYTPRATPAFRAKVEEPLTEVKRLDVLGPESESLMIGYRLEGSGSRDVLKAQLVSALLSNGQAGLLDINLNQEQKVLDAYSFVYELHDYSVFAMGAEPKEGQTLEECEALLLTELDNIRKGNFDEWLIQAVIDDMRLGRLKAFESNRGRAGAHVESFILGKDWKKYLEEHNEMEKISRKEIMAFASEILRDNNYVIVYKRQGEDNSVVKMEKPAITPIEANREDESVFMQNWKKIRSNDTDPEFIDYSKAISRSTLDNGIDLAYIKNELNETFELYYIFDMGSHHDLALSLAVNYLPYLGTEKYTAAELEKEFFRYGLSFNVSTSDNRTYVSLSGLDKNLEKGLELFEHILASVEPDKDKYDEMVNIMLKEREDNKTNKRYTLFAPMVSYAKYGENSAFKHRLSEEDLRGTNPKQLVDKIHELNSYPHKVFYYGSRNAEEVAGLLDVYHQLPKKQREYPEPVTFKELATDQNKVYFVHYDMVQAMVMKLSKDETFNKDLLPAAQAFNEYFGSGLSSIVFQEIRETKALAYSAFASYSTPGKADESHYVMAYVATQADKMKEAVDAMNAIMNDMPQAEKQFDQSVEASVKKIQSERINRAGIFWSYLSAREKGLDKDIREDVYTDLQSMTLSDLDGFFNEHIAGKEAVYLVIGDRTKIDLDYLKSMGEFRELTLEQVYGY